MKQKIVGALLCLAGLACATAPSSVWPQAYPSKPVRLIIPYPPGAGLDLTGRLLQQPISAALGQPFVVENRPGATGQIGAEFVARSAPDGYTIAYTVGSDLVLRKYVSKTFRLDALRDFTPIAPAIESVSCIAVNDSVPANSIKEFIDYAKRNPGKLSFGSAGVGSSQHLMGELFRMQGVNMVHVPYQGLAGALQALLGGQINVSITNFATVKAQLREGKIRVLAVAQSKRFEGAPQVPTVAEVLPGFNMPASWFGFFGPQGMPQPVVARLNAEIRKAVAAPEVAAKVKEYDLAVMSMSPEQLAAFIKSADSTFASIAQAAKIQPE